MKRYLRGKRERDSSFVYTTRAQGMRRAAARLFAQVIDGLFRYIYCFLLLAVVEKVIKMITCVVLNPTNVCLTFIKSRKTNFLVK